MKKVAIKVYDFKGETPKLINLCGDDVAVYRCDQVPRNILAIPGKNSSAYLHGIFACLSRYCNLRPETWTVLPGLRQRMEKSKGTGQADPSLVDFEKMLRKKGTNENRPNLITAARGMVAWIELLGESSRIRKVNDEA